MTHRQELFRGGSFINPQGSNTPSGTPARDAAKHNHNALVNGLNAPRQVVQNFRSDISPSWFHFFELTSQGTWRCTEIRRVVELVPMPVPAIQTMGFLRFQLLCPLSDSFLMRILRSPSSESGKLSRINNEPIRCCRLRSSPLSAAAPVQVC